MDRIPAAVIAALLLAGASASAHDDDETAGRPLEPSTFAMLNAGREVDFSVQAMLDLWDATQKWQATTLTVCFWGGVPATRVAVARKMNDIVTGTTLTFDFGAPAIEGAALRSCTDEESAMIRIGFEPTDPHGPNWSLVGRDSLRSGWPMSVNLAGIREFPSDFDRIVSHEILHALGRLHELQHPASQCQSHIKWDEWENDLKESSGWTHEQFEFNIRSVFFDAVSFEGPTCSTVMMYFVKPKYLVDGANDICFCAAISDITAHDRETLVRMYDPAPTPEVLARLAESASSFPEGGVERTLISQDLQLQLLRATSIGLEIPPDVSAAISRIQTPSQLILNDLIRIEPATLDPGLLEEVIRTPVIQP